MGDSGMLLSPVFATQQPSQLATVQLRMALRKGFSVLSNRRRLHF